MCGILVYKNQGNNFFIQKRGQDFTNKIERNGLTFVHNLLAVTGEFAPQPYEEDGIVCLYNGEIYNHKFVKSDGENLIPLYKKYGYEFPKHLDGEFAIALYDFEKDVALFITDPFATKPLWRNGIECGSYESGVGGHMIEPNTIEAVEISTGRRFYKGHYHRWDWHQHKQTYDDWIRAFEQAIRKRAKERCFIGLSSGYDSGAISKEISKQGIRFKAFSVLNNENTEVVLERAKYVYEFEKVDVEFARVKALLRSRLEDVTYDFGNEPTVLDDVASIGLAAICEKANREGRKVCLSGQGADEIIGDYALYPRQSNFHGVFPERLNEWQNFAGGFQRDYLKKEEYVGGAFNIETRYPFLDAAVVQEFLWLAPELKNRTYKAPLHEYLTINNVPFDQGIKKGFRPVSVSAVV